MACDHGSTSRQCPFQCAHGLMTTARSGTQRPGKSTLFVQCSQKRRAEHCSQIPGS